MKPCAVTANTVAIPVLPEIKWWEHSDNTSVLDIQKRYVHLSPHVLAIVPTSSITAAMAVFDGEQRMAAYDRETDTLFVKDSKPE